MAAPAERSTRATPRRATAAARKRPTPRRRLRRRRPRRAGAHGKAAAANARRGRTAKAAAPDLEALERGLLAAILEDHPTPTSSRSARRSTSPSRPTAGQRRATGRAVRHPPDRARPDPCRARLDPVAIQAALLHDVPEDTEYSLTDIEERFGAEVAQLVDGVTKLSKFSTHSHEQQQAENIRKMLLAMAEDIRVVLIKLADRLHNMRTLYGAAAREAAADRAPDARDLRAARRAPRASGRSSGSSRTSPSRPSSRSGSASWPSSSTRAARAARRYIERAIAELEPRLEAAGIEADLQGRPKHIYSIWKKMQRKGAEFGEIYDVYAIRILVDEVRDCYAALGIVHSLWRPIPGQFDDYIAVPKNNLYQSLHTAVIALDGKPLEIQIRTHADAPGQRGRASPPTGATRKARSPTASTTPSSPGCASSWTGSATSADATEFVEGIKLDIFQDQVFVFTPEGRHQGPAGRARRRSTSPTGSTPTSAIGRSAPRSTTASCPLDYRLKNGDIVEIVTTKAEHGPSRDWLNVVRTSHAREKIRQWFKRQERDENIVHGRESLERELRRLARTSISAVGPDRIAEVAQAAQLRVARRLLRGHRLRRGQRPVGRHAAGRRRRRPDQPCRPVAPPQQLVARPAASGSRASATCSSASRKCCHPIPGDPIVGFITRGKGVTVHLQSCPTVVNEREVGRLIEVEWEAAPTQTYPIAIRVEAYDRTGLLSDITQVVAENKVNILAANVAVKPGPHGGRDGHAPGRLGLPARPGHEPDRAAQGRHQRPARPRLTRPGRGAR